MVMAAAFAFSCAPKKNIAATEQVYSGLEDSVLWKVEHEDLDEPSYIMGTFHIICKSDDLIPEKVENALSEVDELVLEVNFDDPAQMQAMQDVLLESTPISEELTKEEYAALDKKIKDFTGVPIAPLDQMGLFGLQSFVSMKMLDCALPTGYEFELIALAKENGQEVEGLETVKEQMDFLAQAMDKDSFMEYFDDLEGNKKNLRAGLELYKKQEIQKLMDTLSGGEEMSEEELEFMLVRRNNNWIEKIPAMIAEDSALIAVGTGHLLEEYGIIHQLRLKGYKITPVF